MKLNLLKNFKKRTGPVVLVVMDGVGVGKEDKGNAVYLAHPATLEKYMAKAKEEHLYADLKAHGPAVGLPSNDDMGNSEVGHNALGSGQIFAQGAKLVNESLQSGAFFQTQTWKDVVGKTISEKKTIHFIGLLSDGNVHSHIQQLFLMLDGCVRDGAKKIRIHPLLDGRDVAPDSGLLYVEQLETKLASLRSQGVDALIASGGGRMYLTMDRYNSDLEMVRRGWNAHVDGKIESEDQNESYTGYFKSVKEAVTLARKLWPEKQDQYNPPFVIVDEKGLPVGKIQDGDAVINFNFRGDRAIEISEAFEDSNFSAFKRERFPKVRYAGLLEYDGDRHIPSRFLVPPPHIKNVMGEYLCEMNVSSYAIAETHKFGHVTYFWNGNKSGLINESLETYVEVKSDPSQMIESCPEMKAKEVTEKLLPAIDSGKYQFIRVNYANGDMVGHTGNMDSCVRAVKSVDKALEQVIAMTLKKNGIVIVTADHGNCEEKLKGGKPVTSHTLNPVPFFIVDSGYKGEYRIELSGITTPGIANVAATVLNLLGYEAPALYEKSLIRF